MDLSGISGLPIFMDESGNLQFEQDVVVEEAKVRVLDELTPVYLDQDACRGHDVAYFMYNGVYRRRDAKDLEGIPMRYELTLFPEKVVGKEFVKTLGHLHISEPKSSIDYPEICEVLVGTAHFFFQTLDVSGPDSTTAFYVEVKAGEKIIIPPGYDHLTINPGPGPMLFSDVIALGVYGIYDRFKQTRGAAYLEIMQDDGPIFIPNPAYHSVPKLNKKIPRTYPNLGLQPDTPLYTAFVTSRGREWQFLNEPQLFEKYFPTLDHLFLAETT